MVGRRRLSAAQCTRTSSSIPTACSPAPRSNSAGTFARPENALYSALERPVCLSPGRAQRGSAMSVRPYRDIDRRKSRQIHVGAVPVGGGAPITVQSMTNTLTHDVAATVAQIKGLEKAGADIVRVSCH